MQKIAVIGLGYVGLPLAAEFAKKYDVVGFDIFETRINELKNGHDRTLELSEEQVKQTLKNKMLYTTNVNNLKDCNIFIVTVPTPINKNKIPDLTPLIKASETIGKALKKGDIVIYESTVYPGATKEDCVPVLEKFSGLKFNEDFFCGYSPERINPGDKEHTVSKILKITSGSTPETADKVDELYRSIITAGTHKASSMEVAEAAKVIENTQRDINIAFVNELSMIFNRLDINTQEVLEAAGTKWNFLPFRPGLVGGHCIGVDPYYLTHKAQEVGYNPAMILAGRRINDNMGTHVAAQAIKLMIKKGLNIKGSKILIFGLTFKENCPDVRNTRIIDVINELQEFGCNVDVNDPWADNQEVKKEFGFELTLDYDLEDYDAVIMAVAHNEFKNLDIKPKSNLMVYDIKSVLKEYDGRL